MKGLDLSFEMMTPMTRLLQDTQPSGNVSVFTALSLCLLHCLSLPSFLCLPGHAAQRQCVFTALSLCLLHCLSSPSFLCLTDLHPQRGETLHLQPLPHQCEENDVQCPRYKAAACWLQGLMWTVNDCMYSFVCCFFPVGAAEQQIIHRTNKPAGALCCLYYQ